jgi:uncharacterized protein (TIRG00374 family)
LNLASRTAARIALSLLVAAALLALLFAWGGVDVHTIAQTLGRLTPATYLAALGLHLALYVLRAIRFRILIPPRHRPAFLPFLSVCAAHQLAAFALPAKIGEAAFVVYSRQACGVPAAQGIASLVVSRLLDLATLAAALAIACFTLELTSAFPNIAWFTALGLGSSLIALLLFGLSARSDLLVNGAARLSRLGRFDRTVLGARVLSKVEETAVALRTAGGEGRLLGATLISIPSWILIFLFCAVLARGLGLPPETTLAQATFGSSLAILTSLLPVSAFASFGTFEPGWVLGFGLLGIPKDLALATSIGFHVVQLVNIVAIGIVGHAAMGALAKRPAS